MTNKLVRFALLPLVGLVLLVVLGGGWYFSSVLEEDGLRVDNDPAELTLEIVAIEIGSISLRVRDGFEEDRLTKPGVWGISDGVGYGQLGEVQSENDGVVVRKYTGELEIGDHVFFDRTAHPHDPLSAHGIEYDEVTIPGPIGEFGAWYIPGDSDLWTILVHGRTSNRDTSLKILDDLLSLGSHTLTIDYRNDLNAPPSESGYYDFGVTEWEDLEAAVQYALDNGASGIVLVGYSMGGGIVANYQIRSDLAEHTAGIVLDSPMLDFGQTVDHGAADRSVPAPITAVAKFFASMRFGIDWNELNFVSRAQEIDVPSLLIHGDADDTVPISTSIQFADSKPEVVEFHTFSNAGHVAAWNYDHQRYENLVRDFVSSLR